MKEIRLLSLFSGVGAFESALQRDGTPFKLVDYCEIDKYASQSYEAVHADLLKDGAKNLVDVRAVDGKEYRGKVDLITYGFPCQDISLAGKQRGMFNPDGTPTRSGLFFDALRIIHNAQPRMAIAENVKALTSEKFAEQFAMVLDGLDQAGYNSYWKVLNAKDYGIPQNRERVFIVSIRKDLDRGHQMQVDLFGNETPVSQDGGLFPKPVPLKLRLKDLLQPESEVDAKYYLNDKLMGYVLANGLRDENPDIPAEVGEIGNYSRKPFGDTEVIDRNGITQTLRSHATNKSGFAVIGGDRKHATATDGSYAPALAGGHHQFLKIKDATAKGYDEAVDGDGVYIQNIDKKRGTVQHGMIQTIKTSPDVGVVVEGNYMPSKHSNADIVSVEGIAPTVRENHGTVTGVFSKSQPELIDKKAQEISPTLTSPNHNSERLFDGYRIRKLTPRECWRLMGFSDSDFDKAKATGMSDTQLYKQAGNSIVVNVLMALFKSISICDNLTEEGN